MNVLDAARTLPRELVRFDRSKVSFHTPLRNALGVFIPLAVGYATGHMLTGLTISIGALNIAFSDRPGPYMLRAARILLAAAIGAVSVLVGSVTGSSVWLTILLTAVWSFGGGMLAAPGPAPEQIGLTGIILLIVYGAYPLPLAGAAGQAALILLGGVLQLVLAVIAWPLRRFAPERDALAAVFTQLAAYTDSPTEPESGPPVTSEITTASMTLIGPGRLRNEAGEAMRLLLGEAELIRLDLIALDSLHHLMHDDASNRELDEYLSRASQLVGEALRAIAGRIRTPKVDTGIDDLLSRLETLKHTAQARIAANGEPSGSSYAVDAARRVDSVLRRLRTTRDIVEEGSAEDQWPPRGPDALPDELRLRYAPVLLRANLTVASPSFRHAVRLAVTLTGATILAHALGLGRSYWVPLTAAIVLKPDFTSTFTRGLNRIAGTILGLALATGLVALTSNSPPAGIVLVGILALAIRSLGAANFGISAIGTTALVVFLTSIAGTPAGSTMADRAIDTLLGGILALVVYAVWPSWEQSRAPAVLADLLDAYRRYFNVVVEAYCIPNGHAPGELQSARLAARVARSNAQASLSRAANEPVTVTAVSQTALDLLSTSHRLVRSMMAIESALQQNLPHAAPTWLCRLAPQVDSRLTSLSAALLGEGDRDGSGAIPPLEADLPPQWKDGKTGLLISEAQRVVDALEDMVKRVQRTREDQASHP